MIIITGIIVICIIAAVTDYYYHRIPNKLIVAGLLVGLVRVSILTGQDGLVDCISRLLMVIISLFLFFACGMLGAGDVKLLGICTLYLTSERLLLVYALTLIIAAIWGLLLIVRQGDIIDRMKRIIDYLCYSIRGGRLVQYSDSCGRELVIPLAVPLAVAVIVVAVLAK